MDTFACPCDRELDIKQEEKVNKYLDLAVKIKGLWKMKSVKVFPVAKRLEDYLRNINAGTELEPQSIGKHNLARISKDPPKCP